MPSPASGSLPLASGGFLRERLGPVHGRTLPIGSAERRLGGRGRRETCPSGLGPRAVQKGGPLCGATSGPGNGISYHAGSLRGPPGGPPFFLLDVFSPLSLGSHSAALRAHCCSGPSFCSLRAWSREPSVRDLARGIPRLQTRSACRRKPAASLPRCSARVLNLEALKP